MCILCASAGEGDALLVHLDDPQLHILQRRDGRGDQKLDFLLDPVRQDQVVSAPQSQGYTTPELLKLYLLSVISCVTRKGLSVNDYF